jgi:DNA-binding transcriptional ArsR family regulator
VTVHGRYRYRLQLGDAGAQSLALVKAPHLSLVLLLTARSSSSAVGRTARDARASVRRFGRFALTSVLAARRFFPDVVATPIPPAVDVSVDDQVQRLRDLSDDFVVEDLARTFGPELPPVWRPPADMPRRWLDSYASATEDAWSVVSSRWQRAQPLLDLEACRVGAAVVRGCADVLLNALHPRMRYENGEFWVRATREITVGLDGRRLVLVPTVAGLEGVLVGFDLPDVVYIAYPVPGQGGLGERGAAPMGPGEDPLCQVLGRVRAEILRAGGRPIIMGQLAAAVGCSPSTTSYHCGPLEAAGLIVRERHGQSVWLSLTPRGHELVDLLSA